VRCIFGLTPSVLLLFSVGEGGEAIADVVEKSSAKMER
jgi:hypothetical protein